MEAEEETQEQETPDETESEEPTSDPEPELDLPEDAFESPSEEVATDEPVEASEPLTEGLDSAEVPPAKPPSGARSAGATFDTLPISPKGPLEAGYGVIVDAFKALSATFEDTLATMLNAAINVSEPKLAVVSCEQVLSALSSGLTIAHAPYKEAGGGKIIFFASTETAKTLVEMVLGMSLEGEDQGLSTDSLDAYLELINQVCGNINLALSNLGTSRVSTGVFEVFDSDLGDSAELCPEGDFFGAEFGISSVSKRLGAILALIAKSVTDQLAEKTGASTASADDIIKEAFGEKMETSGPLVEVPAATPEAGPGLPVMDERLRVIMDMEMPVYVRFGETQMRIKDLLQLGPDSIIELNKAVDTPVELVVNEDIVIARGEVVVVEANFAIRITEVKSKAERLKGL